MKFLSFAVAALILVGCTTHIAPYKPKKRRYHAGKFEPRPAPTGGSLYASNDRGWFEDDTASRVGDVIVIHIDERDSATRDASTALSKSNEDAKSVSNAFGLVAKMRERFPSIDPAALFGAKSEGTFNGSGKVARKGTLSATLPVRVRAVLPNGDLYVEGTKVVMVGAEEHHIYVSGVVRPDDIAYDNTVPSSRIADAEIEYTGRGDVSDQQRPGFLSRIQNKIWPF